MGDTSASAPAIRTMGDKIGDLKNDIDPVVGTLKGLTVTPGSTDFTDAQNLKTTVEQRRDEVVSFLTTLGTQLDDVKKKLHDNATEIENNEDNNKITADWPSK